MNLVLLHKADFVDHEHVVLRDQRHQYIINVHRAAAGDAITVGLINGHLGQGIITDIANNCVSIKTLFDTPPPTPLPLTLVIALPRPKMLRRILQTCATMGVKKIIFINSYRVEKSYWQTPLLQSQNIEKELITGLAQANDTLMPDVICEKLFKPFVEDRLPDICKNTHALVAHPYCSTPCPQNITEKTTLVIGPEGGFIPYEIEKLQEVGCQAIHIGERILKVETAVPVLLSKLFY